MTIVSPWSEIQAISPQIIQECQQGRWYSCSRVFIFQAEGEKFTAVRMEWYQRIAATFLKLFGVDYFQRVFGDKAVHQLSTEELDALWRKAMEKKSSENHELKFTLEETFIQLKDLDPKIYGEAWQRFLDRYDSMHLEKGQSFQEDFWNYIKKETTNSKSYQSLYLALFESQEKAPQENPRPRDMLRDLVVQKLKDDGVTIFHLRDNSSIKIISSSALEALQKWYANRKGMEKQSTTLLEVLKDTSCIASTHDLGELTKPLDNLVSQASQNVVWTRDLLVQLFDKYVEKSDSFLTLYLKSMMKKLETEFLVFLLERFPDKQGPVFLFIGEYMPEDFVNCWLSKLYVETKKQFDLKKSITVKELKLLAPEQLSKVQGILNTLLSKEKIVSELFKGTYGRIYLCLALNQVSEKVLLKALPFVMQNMEAIKQTQLDNLFEVMENLATDRTRIQNNSEDYDEILVWLLEKKSAIKGKDDIYWLADSPYCLLKDDPQLPLLAQAYQNIVDPIEPEED